MPLSNLNVFAQNPGAWFSGKHIPVFVDSAELRPATGCRSGITALVQNEIPHPTIQGVADSDSLLKTRIVDIVGLGVEHVDQVFIIDREGHPTRHPKLMPLSQKLPFLVEDLNPGVGSIAHEHTAPFVHIDAVRRTELAGRVSGRSPSLNELSILRVLHDAIIRTVAVRDEDISVRCSHNTGWRTEMAFIASGHTRFTERQ